MQHQQISCDVIVTFALQIKTGVLLTKHAERCGTVLQPLGQPTREAAGRKYAV